MKKSISGFTIVELLIVIVVIAVLAGITVTAFNGVTTRARNNQVISAANFYLKAFLSYQAANGTIPTNTGCLGANYPSNQCWSGTSGFGNLYVSSTLDTQLSEFVTNKPTVASTLPVMDASNNRGGLVYMYNIPFSGQGQLRFYLVGNNQNCTVSGFFGYNEGGLTGCNRDF